MKPSKSKKSNNIKTKKQAKRNENSLSRKNSKKRLDDFIEDYKKPKFKSKEDLIEESKKVLKNLNDNTIRDKSELELRYEALLIVMDSKLKKSYKSNFSKKFKGYPDYEDPNFNNKIFLKKEFNINKIPENKELKGIEKELFSKNLCDPMYNKTEEEKKMIEFKLTENQKFLKSFLSPDTPYNSMLLFHGTGVGKTCSSISIAEQYSQQLKKLNKKVIILLNPSIEANFLKNIFNIQKIINNTPYYQCTGSKYLDEIKIDLDIFNKLNEEEKKKLQEQIQSKISKIIKGRYEFYGYQKFANLIENIQQKIKEKYDESEYNYYLNKELKKRFSNTVMIIDEVHNIKKTSDSKVLPPLLEKVVQNAINMKLLLLSATPMFDTAHEIFFLINLLLRNDNRFTIKASTYMNVDGTIKEGMLEDFKRKIQGYISYMRGEDPYRFPTREYPDDLIIDKKDMPNIDKNGKKIDDDNRIKELKIVPCVMKDRQLELYEHMDNSKETGSFNQPGVMCSNIVFPKNKEIRDTRTIKLENFISDKGFNNIIGTTKNGKDIKYNIIDDDYKDFFKLDVLSNYSTKIVEIIKNIEKSDGIVFVYSQYLNSGIIPIALALEKLGYLKYGNALTNNKAKYTSKYIIISGDSDLSENAYSDYLKIQDLNKNGEKIKIILGTQTAAEGLDFSYIRQVHILEPWFHLNRLEQIIGRAIRNCSHIDLEEKDRKVKIFLYAAVKKKESKKKYSETIDLDIYRNAENKSKKMAKIEYLLKENAVDCLLHKHGNYFENDENDESKKCNYEKCKYDCAIPTVDTKLNTDTFNQKIIEDNINDVMKEIIKLYKKNYYYTIDDFIKILDSDKLLIFFALDKLLNYKGKIISKNGSIGKIIYKNNHYIFVKYNSSKFISFNNIRKINSKTKKYNSFNISRNNTLLELEKLNNVPTQNIKKSFFLFEDILKKKEIINKKIEKIKNLYSINLKDKELIIQYLIIQSIQKKTTKDQDALISSFSYNILYCKKDLICKSIKDNEIWGYKIADNKKIRYMKCDLENKKFKNANANANLNDITQLKKTVIKNSKKQKRGAADIIGYCELKNNELIFKIRDKTNQGNNEKKSQIKTGETCETHKKQFLQNYIKKLQKKPLFSNNNIPNKSILCLELEKILKDKDSQDKTYRYLYGPEETIEYNLNKK